MSRYSAASDDVSRPKSTKNVYFFKSGDHQFGGVKVAVNLRKHRNLDALLDDLSSKVPGLSHGVRQLRTPHGRTLVTDLSQLEHRGGYVCSEKLNTNTNLPGVNFKKIKGLKDFQYNQNEQARLPPSPPVSPKKRGKTKKKKKDKEEENDIDAAYESPDERQPRADIIDFEKEVSDDGREPPPPKPKNSPKKKKKRSKIPKASKSANEQRQEQIDDTTYEYEEEFGSRTPKPYSAPGTPSEQRRLENNLTPLDNKKLKHVQRRRISSKQINVDDYTLPNSKTNMSMNSAFSMRNEDDESNEILRSKPPKSKPSTAMSTTSTRTTRQMKGYPDETVQREETQFEREKSHMNDDDEEDRMSIKSNEIGEESDRDEFDEGEKYNERRNSRFENESDVEKFENENESEKIEKEKDEEEEEMSQQKRDEQSKSRLTNEDSNAQIEK